MLSDPIQISIAADQMLQFFRKFSANPFSKKNHVCKLWAFSIPPLLLIKWT